MQDAGYSVYRTLIGKTRDRGMLSQRGVLFLASFLTLYFELVLIRWVPGHVRVLGYFTNFVLIGCFFGVGLGMILSKSRRDLGRWAPVGIAGIVLLAIACRGLWVMPMIEDQIGRASCRERV